MQRKPDTGKILDSIGGLASPTVVVIAVLLIVAALVALLYGYPAYQRRKRRDRYRRRGDR